MMTRHSRPLRLLGYLTILTMVAAACGTGGGASSASPVATSAAPVATGSSGASAAPSSTSGDKTPIVVGDLAYFTGPFGPNGPQLAAEAEFPIKEVINLDPPLGRPITIIHEDIGTVGEGQAAKKLLEQDGADILLSPAHEYFTYRDYILNLVKEEDRPLMPSVHGGVIPGNIGGTAAEPLFRAQGLDEGVGVTDILYAQTLGAKSVAIIATQTAGFQLIADAAAKAAPLVGLTVLGRVDAPESATSYRAEVQKVAAWKADALLVLAPPAESGTVVKNIAEAGLSTNVLLESGSSEMEFYNTATAAAIATQKAVLFPGFGHQDNAAWKFFQPLWDNNPKYAAMNPATGFFAYTTYDLLIITALAIEKAGSTKASAWAPAMYAVTSGANECYTYADCIAMIRSGKDIHYQGVTGPGTFSPSGVNAVTNAIFQWDAKTGKYAQIALVDPAKHLEILNQVAKKYVAP